MNKTCKKRAIFLMWTLFLSVMVFSQDLPCHVGPKTIRAYSVANSNSVCLFWPANEYRLELRIARRIYTNRPSALQNWTEIHAVTDSVVAAQASEYCDMNVSSGIPYEYRISVLITNYDCNFRTKTPYWHYQHICTGTEVPLRDERGKLILLVESGLAKPLAPEIARLQDDLIGDGYEVFRHDVAANEVTNANWFASVTNTKALIRADYNTDPNADWTIFIVGHVPIPYSGLSSPGGHTENYGAHPADWYYADMDESAWTDKTVNNVSGEFNAQHNVPGDGKFDQSNVPTAPEMRIGRVDLRNLPAFGKSEVELLRQYLDRDHAWRHKQFTVRDLGIINSNNNVGLIYRGMPHDSHDIQSSFFGTTNTTILGSWLGTAASPNNNFLLAASFGNGEYDRDFQIGRTTGFAATNLYAVFTTMYGSYYGDWDSAILTNAVLLAPLASGGYTLSTYYHENIMNVDSSAMGEPIGYELYAQAASSFFGSRCYYAFGYVNTNLQTFINYVKPRCYLTLMGDPTLRMRVVAPPSNVTVVKDGGDNVISWAAAVDTNIRGYHLYRAPSANLNGFVRLTSAPVMTISFRDVNAAKDAYRYMVRSAKLEQSAGRSFYNASQGILANQPPAAPSRLRATYNPVDGRSLLISGEPGQQYIIENAANLSNVTLWYPLTNITLSSPTGTISVANTNPVIFYRLKN